MKIAIMQPYLFPHLGYFQLINLVDRFILLDDVTYIKSGWINRNYILVGNNPGMFTFRLKNSSSNRRINEIEIEKSSKWRNKFLKTINQNYRKAPFFDNIYPIIDDIVKINVNNISELNYYSLCVLIRYIGINVTIKKSSNYLDNLNLKGQERVLDICKKEEAKVYINSIGGRALYDSNCFKKNGINLKFLETNIIEYTQFKNNFVPGLSIIDVLMFNSPQKVKDDLLLEYKLID